MGSIRLRSLALGLTQGRPEAQVRPIAGFHGRIRQIWGAQEAALAYSRPMPGPLAVLGTMMECDMGDAPGFLIVEPTGVFANDLPVGTIFDIIPFVNLPGFILCHSPLNPEVIIETAAAMGVPMPAPCIPIVVDPWMPPGNVLIDGMPALTEGSVCECLWAGTIVLSGPSPAMNVEAI